ncbi:MAG: helix-turn-helix domain-containing protein, partial [Firmicutes bacterium]|nr:helix-turn-helix domain-containing protein [Bacillota bacterium]
MPAGEYLTAAQVGEYLGITPAGVKRLVKDGHLEIKGKLNFKHGETFYFDRAEVKELLPRMPGLLRRWESEESARMGAEDEKQAIEKR